MCGVVYVHCVCVCVYIGIFNIIYIVLCIQQQTILFETKTERKKIINKKKSKTKRTEKHSAE